MSSSSGRILSRQIKTFSSKESEKPPSRLVQAALAYLSRTERIARWESDSRAFNRMKAHRTVAFKFVEKYSNPDE